MLYDMLLILLQHIIFVKKCIQTSFTGVCIILFCLKSGKSRKWIVELGNAFEKQSLLLMLA